ncbi:ABC transporter permease [Bifidobacterium callimiconis]|uniref:ABC transporter permease n=1 Tax=Bifidobacterium callimiconis TaxID=2306973 RepID=UPI001BDCAC49|nr:ABC transporter permease [Bifidobacterium callimiconis]MBT1178028.1 ABC transporter permease [Bifidobacterium callimiconis]
MSNTTNPNIKSDKPPIDNDKSGKTAVVTTSATASKTSAPKETAWQHWFGSPHEVKPGLLHRAYAVPSIIIGLLFTLGPMCVIVAFSFMSRPDMGGGVKFQFSTDAYEKLLFRHDFFGNRFFDTRYLEVFGTSLWQALLTTVVCVALAFPIALWMSMKSAKTQQILVLLVTIPFWTNLLVRTYAWMLILNENGPINWAANLLGLGKQQLLYTSFASVIGLIYTFLPFAILPMYSALSGFDFRLVEAAYDLGARKLTVMRRVILRAAMPGVMSGVALCFIPAFGSYVQPVLLGGGRVLMVGNLIASQFAEARNWPFGAALSTVILAITLLGAFLATALGGRASRKAGMTL